MTRQEILGVIERIARERLSLDATLSLSTSLLGELELDSLEQLMLITELEDHFRICFDEADEEGLRTVGDLVILVERRLREAGEPVAVDPSS